MLSLKQILKEATEEQDAAFRGEAVRFYDKMLDYVEDAGSAIDDYVAPINFGNMKGSFVLNAEQVDPKYKDLFIVFSEPVAGYQGGFGRMQNTKDNYILFPALEKGSRSMAGSLENASYLKDTFVHEFIHYLDSKRWKGGSKDFNKWQNINKMNKDDDSKYYNLPMELNAYYQQAAFNITSAIENAVRSGKEHRLKLYLPEKVETFVKLIKEKLMDKRISKNLTPDNMRKLDKRLAMLWQDLKNKYGT